MSAKRGELKARWSRRRSDCAGISELDSALRGDLLYERGDGIPSADGHLLHNALTGKRLSFLKPLEMAPSFVEHLVARGYDLSTLRFYIRKKRAAARPSGDERHA